MYGWKSDIQRAVRQVDGMDELALECKEYPPPEEAPDTGAYSARWEDGSTAVITAVTNAYVRQLIGGVTIRAGHQQSDVLYETTHKVTRHKLTMRMRTDKHLLVSCLEQDRKPFLQAPLVELARF